MKARLRDAIGAVAARGGLLAAAERRAHDSLTVLCYHRVLPANQRAAYHDPDLVVTPETFTAHCKLLAERFTVEPLEVALSRWTGGERPRRPFAAVTFDDGYRDNVRYAAPILEAHALRATFFVIAGLVDSESIPWYDAAGAAWNALKKGGNAPDDRDAKDVLGWLKQLPALERMAQVQQLAAHAGYLEFKDEDRIMTSEQVRELASMGHEIGSHSMTHPLLTLCDDAALTVETVDSRARLREIANQKIRGICYPNGNNDARVHQAVVRAGYTYAASMLPGLNQPTAFDTLAVQRWFVHQERLSDRRRNPSPVLLRMELSGLSQRLLRRGARQ